MGGRVCLQGGAELQPGCEQMDAEMLRRDDGAPRSVLVLPFAGRPGREQQQAWVNARSWYTALGARQMDVVLDDDEVDPLLADAELVVLPGGSPGRLLEALQPHRAALAAVLERGASISGASAGAMVLCRWTVLPGGAVPRVVPALGLVDVDLVLPHFTGSTGWLDAARPALPPDPAVLGLPERSGVVIDGAGGRHEVGVTPVTVLS